MSTKPKFNQAQCSIDDIGFIVCKNIEGVVGVLQAEGYPIEKMNTVEDVYGYTMKFLDAGGQQAQEKLMRVHPHKLYILEAEENTGKKDNATESKAEPLVNKSKDGSSYTDADSQKKDSAIALNLTKEHIAIFVVVVILLILMIPKK